MHVSVIKSGCCENTYMSLTAQDGCALQVLSLEVHGSDCTNALSKDCAT